MNRKPQSYQKFKILKDTFYSSVGFFNNSVIYNCRSLVGKLILDSEIIIMQKKNIISLFWVGFGVNIFFFIITTDDKTIENFFYGLLICLVYSFFLGIGNAMTNELLNKKFSWTEQTRARTIFGIIALVFINVIISYLCGYLNFVVIQQKATTAAFFSEKYNTRRSTARAGGGGSAPSRFPSSPPPRSSSSSSPSSTASRSSIRSTP